MSHAPAKYINIYGRTCYSSKPDHSGPHVEVHGNAACIRDVGLEVDVSFEDIPWLIETLRDVLKQRQSSHG